MLKKGDSKQAIFAILGEPDYSPSSGIYYFSAVETGEGQDCPLGVIVEFDEVAENEAQRDADVRLLESTLGEICE